MMSVWFILTTLTAAAAGGGGGGGGGGGATRKVINCVFVKASVNKSGNNTSIPISITWKIKEITVVIPRLVFNLLPDSMRLSSNIRILPAQPYVFLDTACFLFAPKPGLHPTRQFHNVNPLKTGHALSRLRKYLPTLQRLRCSRGLRG